MGAVLIAGETSIQRPPGRVDELLIGRELVRATLDGLRAFRDTEGLCYWIGSALGGGGPGTRAVVTTVAFPRIYTSPVSFRLAEGELAHLTTWCAERGLWILAQVHTHPNDEPHSDADDCWPASTRPGFWSLVVPYFAGRATTDEPGWYGYEREASGEWSEIDIAARVMRFPMVLE